MFPSIISTILARANIIKGKWPTMIIVYNVTLLIVIKIIENRKESNVQLDRSKDGRKR